MNYLEQEKNDYEMVKVYSDLLESLGRFEEAEKALISYKASAGVLPK